MTSCAGIAWSPPAPAASAGDGTARRRPQLDKPNSTERRPGSTNKAAGLQRVVLAPSACGGLVEGWAVGC